MLGTGKLCASILNEKCIPAGTLDPVDHPTNLTDFSAFLIFVSE